MPNFVLIGIIVVAAFVAVLWARGMSSRRGRAVPVPLRTAEPAAVEAAVVSGDIPPDPEPPLPPEPESDVPPSAQVRWAKQFEPSTGALDDDARLKLIGDLALLRAAWCVPLLTQAYEEEAGVAQRRAVLAALAAYRDPGSRATFECALRDEDPEQRALAAAALTELGIAPALSS